jgi:hypothetical protein
VFDLNATWDALKQWNGFLQNHVPVDRWPNPVLWSGVAALLGVVLVFWGARLLRGMYVLAFMAIGGAVGIRLAGVRQVDLLIGLSLGAGVGALLAFFLFRWWVGLTTGGLAVLILLAAGSPRLNDELTNYNNVRLGVGSGDFSQALQVHEEIKLDSWDQVRQFGHEFWDYLRDQRRRELITTSVGLGLVWLLGTLAGLLLPRLVTIGLTSVGGVCLLAIGASVLLSTRWPAAWSGILANRGWFLAALAVLLVAGISYQARHRRAPIPLTTPAPAAV